MPLRETQAWLLAQSGFRSDVDRLQELAVARQFPSLIPVEHLYPYKPDWGRLLFAASLLAQGGSAHSQEVALRIAQTSLEDPGCSPVQRDGAAVILDELSNRRAISLATDRRLLAPDIEDRLGVAGLVDWTRRGIEHSIDLPGGDALHASAFQRRFWREIPNADWLSASAPTSAGKSYIITQWLVEQLARGDRNVVYIAPTRALIQQVERDLRETLREHRLGGITTITIPFNSHLLARDGAKVLVFTQERLHYFLRHLGNAIPLHAIIVDEAHKIGDRHRGVLLQDVIEQASRLNPAAKVIFASPLAENPGALVADAPAGTSTNAMLSDDVTVNQNLLWLDRVKGRGGVWELSLRLADRSALLGEIHIDKDAGTSARRKLAHLAAACDAGGGTLVYVDGADAAENVAARLSKLLPMADGPDLRELQNLAELARVVVHRNYGLSTVLRNRVAFHYGNMPLVLRSEIEDLFRSGTIRFLVCTSTLVEGVNLPCRTLLVRAPKRGDRPMDAADFWNLAGRAGRWGKEFQGNIVCVDAKDEGVWAEGPPKARARYKVERSTDRILADQVRLIEFLRAGAISYSGANEPELETMASYLTATVLKYGSLSQAPWGERVSRSFLAPIEEEIRTIVDEMEVPTDLVSRHPGISPTAMTKLLRAFRTMPGRPEELLPVNPTGDDAPKRYSKIFDLIGHHLSSDFGARQSSFGLALTTCEWMRGYPIARIVSSKLAWHKRQKTGRSTPKIIRDTLRDIEEIARFQAPRLLACYIDVLAVHLQQIGREDLMRGLPDLTLALEFGVANQTQLAFLSIGLTRSAALAVTDLLREDFGLLGRGDAADSLTEEEVSGWLLTARLAGRGLPTLILREVEGIRLSQLAANDR